VRSPVAGFARGVCEEVGDCAARGAGNKIAASIPVERRTADDRVQRDELQSSSSVPAPQARRCARQWEPMAVTSRRLRKSALSLWQLVPLVREQHDDVERHAQGLRVDFQRRPRDTKGVGSHQDHVTNAGEAE